MVLIGYDGEEGLEIGNDVAVGLLSLKVVCAPLVSTQTSTPIHQSKSIKNLSAITT